MARVSSAHLEKESQAVARSDVKSAARVLDILELLSESPEGLTLTDIGKQLDIPLSSLHGLTATMVNRGYALRNDISMLYHLGPRLSQVAASYQGQIDLVSLADPVMLRLRNQTGETTSLSVLEGNVIVFVHKRPAQGRVQVVNPVGTRLPAHASGSGKVMLSYLSEAEIDQLFPEDRLPSCTQHTITSKQRLRAALAEAREKGYAYDDQESDVGVWAVASCIRSKEGNPVGALSIVAPLFRIQEKGYLSWYRYVRTGAAEISAMLGFRSS